MNFERGQDIYKAIGIGLWGVHKFKDDYEAADFIIENLPEILGIDSINDLGDHPFQYKGSYEYDLLVKYTVDCIIVEDGNFRKMTYDAPDGSLIWAVESKITNQKIRDKARQMAEEKGYEFREG